MPDTLITIGITCYREGDWLRECWESVLAQTDDRWVAVFVMDGGADEKTREVFASIEHPKVVKKFAFEGNVGPYPVRNKAFELTGTPYHFYLDGDDMLPPGCIAAMYRTLEEHPDAAYVYGDVRHHPSGLNSPRPAFVSSPSDLVSTAGGLGLYSVAAWERLGRYPEVFGRGGGDTDLKISIYEAGFGIYNCGELFYVCRIGNEGSVFTRRASTSADVALTTVSRHPVFFSEASFRKDFLKGFFGSSICANIFAGNRVGSLRYVRLAFRHLGVFRTDTWLWLLKSVLGREGMNAFRAIKRGLDSFTGAA